MSSSGSSDEHGRRRMLNGGKRMDMSYKLDTIIKVDETL